MDSQRKHLNKGGLKIPLWLKAFLFFVIIYGFSIPLLFALYDLRIVPQTGLIEISQGDLLEKRTWFSNPVPRIYQLKRNDYLIHIERDLNAQRPDLKISVQSSDDREIMIATEKQVIPDCVSIRNIESIDFQFLGTSKIDWKECFSPFGFKVISPDPQTYSLTISDHQNNKFYTENITINLTKNGFTFGYFDD
jgi:hypothetical protein